MRIQELVYDVIVENFRSKAQFDRAVKKWFGENPTEEQIKKADDMLTLFMQKQKSLDPSNPIVYSFLTRFDGTYKDEFPIFDPKNLKDPLQYTLNQMESLLNDFSDGEVEVQNSVFAEGGKYTSLDKIKASYELWKGDENKIIDEGDFRVYYIPDQRTSMRYGYYSQALVEWDNYYLKGNYPDVFNDETKKELQQTVPYVGAEVGAQWCVTGRGTSDSRGNMWGNYRDSRTFYFVIDESKELGQQPRDINRYYISALQVEWNSRQGYRLTSALNDGDMSKTWEDLLKIYPKLAEHKDKIVEVKYDSENELENNRDIIARINENENNRLEFRRVEKIYKKAFLERGGVISKAHSWRSMDPKLRENYILSTTHRNVLDKFQSYELMNEIRKKGSEFNLLNKRLSIIGAGGIGYIYDHLMRNEFDIARTSLDNQNIRLYKSKKTNKLGLYNATSAQWVNSDGIVFEPTYNEIDTAIYMDEEGKTYVVETFSESGEPTPTSLYCVYPVEETNEYGSGHFVTAQKFELLKQKIRPSEGGDDIVNISDFNPEQDVDIKEMKKGL